jgi:hypothetical protein
MHACGGEKKRQTHTTILVEENEKKAEIEGTN